ncbi:hypothetical protein ZWY2020_025044 [Hordeum vulgare]|nr:hypothetical protein ZWY2020_025044 [Hordeum vulgare]
MEQCLMPVHKDAGKGQPAPGHVEPAVERCAESQQRAVGACRNWRGVARASQWSCEWRPQRAGKGGADARRGCGGSRPEWSSQARGPAAMRNVRGVGSTRRNWLRRRGEVHGRMGAEPVRQSALALSRGRAEAVEPASAGADRSGRSQLTAMEIVGPAVGGAWSSSRDGAAGSQPKAHTEASE